MANVSKWGAKCAFISSSKKFKWAHEACLTPGLVAWLAAVVSFGWVALQYKNGQSCEVECAETRWASCFVQKCVASETGKGAAAALGSHEGSAVEQKLSVIVRLFHALGSTSKQAKTTAAATASEEDVAQRQKKNPHYCSGLHPSGSRAVSAVLVARVESTLKGFVVCSSGGTTTSRPSKLDVGK